MMPLVRVALLAVTVLVLALAGNVLSVGTTPVVFEPRATASPPPSRTSTGPRAFRLTLSEQQLTDAASSSFPRTVSGVTVRDPVVRITPSDVRLLASARLPFGTTQFAVSGLPYASGGVVAVRVESVTLAGIALPESVRAPIAASVQSVIAKLVSPTATIQRVSLGNATITIEGVEER